MNYTLFSPHGAISSIAAETAVTVGVFDGVHRGHRNLLQQLASQPGLAPLVVTLTAHPSYVLGRRPSEYWLDDPQEHLDMLFDAGAQYVAVVDFTREVSHLTACTLARWLHSTLHMRSLLLGYDSRFGSRSNDDFDQLPNLAGTLGFSLLRSTPFEVGGAPISSSRIRATLEQGDVEQTSVLLGRPYTVHGRVVHGRGVGRALGFPTANIDLSQTRKMLPKEGTYAVRMASCSGMAHLGAIPTYGLEDPTLEVHLIGFDGDLYGQQVEVQFLRRLRDTVRFDTPEALQAQLQRDLFLIQS